MGPSKILRNIGCSGWMLGGTGSSRMSNMVWTNLSGLEKPRPQLTFLVLRDPSGNSMLTKLPVILFYTILVERRGYTCDNLRQRFFRRMKME
ncbi:hypothetical protein Hamer_G003518 [Homarus americanus]|uniref:Uncharacterized protein n=1 Tax=Homarus americanus TaxID=6706 RepID=A0A8J5MUA8_HOMAM|nr:hypothetical protein Hamer_G003518 [Homarus americanus]